MAIVTQTVIRGPEIQAHGEYRGVVEFTFDDASVVRRRVRAKDATEWAARLAALDAEVQTRREVEDAYVAVDGDTDIAAAGQATIKHVALWYLRRAYQTGDPWKAYKLFDRFNTYRINQGWTPAQVVTQLSSVGLTQDEWDLMAARYAYLSDAARVTLMSNYQTLLTGDTWGQEYR